ncbi:three-helix bundle dimerization domain-containing protein [Microbacterium terricola]|uniref:CUE domain-containing protein n=1 Tax=Microbacterium terricola TaxID=344163 RepID=A0ABM8E1R5_9MICO|nr:hypothetical protein [Microbacterium terricola]UYK40394.1 hypothetical protein OAU46_01710 [Microbacterium terricola]BDV31888.1 hypothetical protein Microterr_25480 [Microbacterium terricola]
MPEKAPSESEAIDHVVHRLRERFPDVPEAEVVAAVRAAHASMDDARVRDFVPVLVERAAKTTLKARSS